MTELRCEEMSQNHDNTKELQWFNLCINLYSFIINDYSIQCLKRVCNIVQHRNMPLFESLTVWKDKASILSN